MEAGMRVQMTDAKTARADSAKRFDFSKVARCRIHPGIGIARVGNSPDEYFTGPEAPCDPRQVATPPGGFKDAQGRVKRQAARFRVYAYDSDGNNLGELPIGGPDDRKSGHKAEIAWKVHLKNKKGAWCRSFCRFNDIADAPPHNPDIPVGRGRKPDDREELIVDPGPRWINGQGKPPRQSNKSQPIPDSLRFDTGSFRGTKVPLGEIRVDAQGHLRVLGGFGKSASTKPNNPIGADANDVEFWAANNYWYDDVSDGSVTATVLLPDGPDGQPGKIRINRPEDAAWVVVAPPKFAPGIYSIVTTYDVMREVVRNHNKESAPDHMWHWPDIDDRAIYFRDIYPILLRASEMPWVNDRARRGHGYGKAGEFTKLLSFLGTASPKETEGHRVNIFFRLRDPDAKGKDAIAQANNSFMPQLSGDGGDATEGDPETWLSILSSQYRKFQQWSDGDFENGEMETFPALQDIHDPEQQVVALQRAALEPCVGGPLFPGIEVPWIIRDNTTGLYADAFRINSEKHGPGDITKYMCVPWQADFYDCKDTWWPAARPDDVIPEEVFEEANKAWQPGQPPVSEALEGRESWDRGLGVTTLFRRPWHNPPDAEDDPRDSGPRGCDDMVRYWHELGFVVPRKTAWHDGVDEIVQIETERRPYAGMDVRELFHCLLNIDQHRGCLPKVQEFVDNVLEQARQLQLSADAFAFMENIRPFQYDEEIFEERMRDIYDDCADFAFSFNAGSPVDNPHFRTSEAITTRIRQLTPFNFLDGSWLRNIHRVGPVDEVNSILFSILKEELGDGVPSQNHANIYRDLCHSFGFYPPPIESTAFARDPNFLDAAFDSPAFQLGISEFSNRYYPEIIGMTLWLEWTVLELHRIAAMVERVARVESVNLSSHFYRMHIAIDNAASGHGAGILRAVKLYLRQVRAQGGEPAVQYHWKRIWDGYVAFAHTFVIIIMQIVKVLDTPQTLQERLEDLIDQKRQFGQFNHNRKELKGTTVNDWFDDPGGLLDALIDAGYIVPGKPDESKFFKLLEFRGGPMYHVFTEDEIKLWRDWTLEKGQPKKAKRARSDPAALTRRLTKVAPDLVASLSNDMLGTWQRAASDRRIQLWVELAESHVAAIVEKARTANEAEPDKAMLAGLAIETVKSRFTSWLGFGMVRALTYIAAQHRPAFDGVNLVLTDARTNEQRTIGRWLDQIREAPNPTAPACALLRALATGEPDGWSLQRVVRETPLGRALNSVIPGNDGRRAKETMEAWVNAGFPVPEQPSMGRVKPMRLDSSLDEEERHPTGVVMGFGTVH
jgi:hypothetical protein